MSGSADDRESPAEADEADVAEQQTSVDPELDDDGAALDVPTDAEASEGDLVEQAIAVPMDAEED